MYSVVVIVDLMFVPILWYVHTCKDLQPVTKWYILVEWHNMGTCGLPDIYIYSLVMENSHYINNVL